MIHRSLAKFIVGRVHSNIPTTAVFLSDKKGSRWRQKIQKSLSCQAKELNNIIIALEYELRRSMAEGENDEYLMKQSAPAGILRPFLR